MYIIWNHISKLIDNKDQLNSRGILIYIPEPSKAIYSTLRNHLHSFETRDKLTLRNKISLFSTIGWIHLDAETGQLGF